MMKRLIIHIAPMMIAASLAAGLSGCGGGEAERVEPHPPPAVPPERIEASLAAAEDYLNADQSVQAEAILRRLIDRAPAEGRAHEMLGRVLLSRAVEKQQRGDRARALELQRSAYEHYRLATERGMDTAEVHLSAGQVAQMIELDEEALQHYERARSLDEANAQAHFLAAQVLLHKGRLRDAERAVRRTLEIDPDEPWSHATLANIAVQRGRLDQALEHIAEAREIAPREVTFRVIEASIHRMRGDPSRAVQLLAGLSAEERGRHFVAGELAAAHAASGDHYAAAEAWAHAWQANQVHPEAWRAAVGAGRMMLEAGERESAWMWLQQAKLAAPREPEVRELEQAIGGG